MTISSTTTKNSYSGNGSTTTFAYGFYIPVSTDIQVYIRATTGTETLKSEGTGSTNYAITNVGNASGGNIVFVTAPLSSDTVVLRRNTAKTQATDYVANDPFPAETHEDALDKLTIIGQDLQEQVDRSLKISKTNTMTSTDFTNSAANRASKVLAFDSSGELSVTQELGNALGNWAASTAYVLRDIVKDTNNNNIYICITAHTSSGSVPLSSNTDAAKWRLLVDAASSTTSATAAAASATTATAKATAAASSATAAASSATAAASSASTSSTQATASASSATSAAASLTTFTRQYHGAAGSDPSSNVDTGDLYFKTDGSGMQVYNGSAWVDVKPSSSEQTDISALAASAVIADMALLATTDCIADMALLATSDIISDMNTLATSDIVSDLNTLATSDIVTDINVLATSDIVSDLNTLATSDIVSDLNTLATSDIVTDINVLATSDIVSDLNTLATSAIVTDLNLLATSDNVANMNTVADNIAGVNSFAERYRVGSSDPGSDNDEGDLIYNSTSNVLKYYNGSAFVAVTAPDVTYADATALSIALG